MLRRIISIFWILLSLMIVPVQANESDLTGVWEVDGFTHDYGAFRFFVDVTQNNDQWVAIKLNSSRYVPRNNVHFRARVQGETVTAQVQVALPGFSSSEWKRHNFAIIRDSTEKIIRIELTSGEGHVAGAEGERNFQDHWVYRRWPTDQFRLLAPKITDIAYRAEKAFQQSQLDRVARDAEAWMQSLVRAQAEHMAAQTAFANSYGNRASLEAASETLWNAAVMARAQIGQETPVETNNMPPRLRVLYDSINAENAAIARREAIILASQNGTATQSSSTISALFSAIKSSRATIRSLQNTIAEVETELGIAGQANPIEEQRSAAATATDAYTASLDPYYAARRTELRSKTELFIAQGQVDLARTELAELEIEKSAIEERLKVLNEKSILVRIDAFRNDDLTTPVYQAIPSGLNRDLIGLQAEIATTRELLGQAREARQKLLDSFKTKFDEGTVLRDQLADLIWENAVKQAMVQGSTKLAEFTIAFGTGGPVGLAIEMVSTPIFQNVFYEGRESTQGFGIIEQGGVIFSNYDESALQNAYSTALRDATASEPDPSEVCRDLNLRIAEGAQSRVFNATGFVNAATPDTTGIDGIGNPSQRVAENWQHYSLYFMSQTAQEGAGAMAKRMQIIRPGYIDAERAARSRIILRAAENAPSEAVQELAELDARIAARATTAAERTVALETRNALLNRIAGESPELARHLASSGQDINLLMRQIAWKQRVLDKGFASASSVPRLEAAIVRDLERIAARQQVTQAGLRGAAAHINWVSTLAHHTQLNEALARELAKVSRLDKILMGIERTAIRTGTRGTTAGSAVSIVASMVFAGINELNQNRLQQQERALWTRVFAAELQQSLRFKVWQRATCIYWAIYDQYYSQRRLYSQLYAAYDPETGFELLVNESIRSNESFDMRMIYEQISAPGTSDTSQGNGSVKAHNLEVMVGTVACPETTKNGCRIASGALVGQAGPYLALDIKIGPKE